MSSAVTVTLTLPDGKRKYYRGATRKEAEAKRNADKLLLLQGVKVSDHSRVSDIAELWFSLNYTDAEKHSKTRENVRGILDRHILPAIGIRKISNVKPSDIQTLVNQYSGSSQSLNRQIMQALNGIFNTAVDNGMIPRSPVTSSVRAAGDAPEEVVPLTDAQAAALLDAVSGTRAAPFVALLLYAGLRRGEACGLMWRDVDLASGILHVERSVVYTSDNQAGTINANLKTKNARRDIPICPELAAMLTDAQRRSESIYTFPMANGCYMSSSSFRSMWSTVDRRADALGFTVHPHQLRHTCITRWIERGLSVEEVQYLAGHASAQTTLNIYTHYRRSQRLEETRKKMCGIL